MEYNSETAMKLYSVEEASKQLGIGVRYLYRLMRRQKIKTVKLGRRRLISVRAINEFINEMEE